MKKFYRLFLSTVLLATCSTSPAAIAGQKYALSHSSLASNQTNNISEQAAVTIAKQHINGRVLAISRTNNAYRIKILSDKGTVHIISVNSSDGSVSSTH
jgi:starvation-inducible outer membrane lipoprotein